VRFLVDAQLPPALARWLTGAGYVAQHVAEVGLAAANDEPIWRHAAATGAVIVTKDEDFAARRVHRKGSPSVVWLRIGNASNRALLQWFEPLLPEIVARLEQGEVLIEIV
jgi:predicted nuclease of predicted toxin-antitoxin system